MLQRDFMSQNVRRGNDFDQLGSNKLHSVGWTDRREGGNSGLDVVNCQ